MENNIKLLAKLNEQNKNTLMETLGIEYVYCNMNELHATMEVTPKVHQPYGLLHGGASVALAETVGSFLSVINVDRTKYYALGLEISANHIRSISKGIVTAKASFVHKGRSTHVLKIEIVNAENKIISSVKMTNIVLPINT